MPADAYESSEQSLSVLSSENSYSCSRSYLKLSDTIILLLVGGELLAQRCRTDDLLPSIRIFCLPPCRMDPKVLRLDILMNRSQPGGSWSSNVSPPVCWWP